jgi:alanine racemase
VTSFCSATVNTAALKHNLQVVRAAAPGSRVMAVIKANAYGHGIVPVARALASADALAVARLAEARQLRKAGIDSRVVLLEGVNLRAELEQAAQLGLDLVVHNDEQVRMLEDFEIGDAFSVWLKIDTGMNRLGITVANLGEFLHRLLNCGSVRGVPRLMSHLANADDREDTKTQSQMREFAAITDTLGCERTLANSGGLFGWRGSHYDWVRPGIALYGVTPFGFGTGADLGLRPAMRLNARIIALREVGKGESVGYGGNWCAPVPTRIAVAGIGYGDGYPRHLGNNAPVALRGRNAPLLGRVSMDMITLGLADHPDAAIGDEVTLWGEELPVEQVARLAGTIPYELLCGVTQRVDVRYVT